MTIVSKADHPIPKAGVLNIAVYVPGRRSVSGLAKAHKLSSNETPLGPSPHAVEAYRNVGKHLQLYPDGQAMALKQAIAETHGLPINHVICGNGSDELLGLLAQTYLVSGDEAIITEHGFHVYKIQTLAAGASPITVKENNACADVDAILAALTPRTRIVFIANPNNPTGTYLTSHEVKRLHSGLPQNVLLVLDAAYAEYVQRHDYEAGIEFVSQNQNIVMTRTFSKIYGLAGLRIGWMYAPVHVIDAVERVRQPFNLNSAAIVAGAAAIRDRDHMKTSVAHNSKWLHWLDTQLKALGLHLTPSAANFLLIHFPNDPEKSAEKADAYLMSQGYILRRVSSYGFPNALRLTVGSEEANRGVVVTLSKFLK